ncbi:hypothetical protein [Jeotgalibacillus sp. R-1-5s-1]|nr:hypothetical protein [Jeotgalibacillus sp. R-1-5s-1]
MVKHLAREHFVYKMDKGNAQVLTVQSGDQAEVVTYDCFENQVKSVMT